MTKLMTKVTEPAEVPEGPHYAILEFHTVEESTGWPEQPSNTVSAPHYYVTTDRDAWEAHIRALVHGRIKYVAMKVEGKAKVERPIIIV